LLHRQQGREILWPGLEHMNFVTFDISPYCLANWRRHVYMNKPLTVFFI